MEILKWMCYLPISSVRLRNFRMTRYFTYQNQMAVLTLLVYVHKEDCLEVKSLQIKFQHNIVACYHFKLLSPTNILSLFLFRVAVLTDLVSSVKAPGA